MAIIVVDLDNSLCNCDHRIHHALNKDWDAFHEALMDDVPNPDVYALIKMMDDLYSSPGLFFLTGRNERYRPKTLEWLKKHNINPDKLIMRPDNDFTPDHEIKIRMLEEELGGKEKVLSLVLFVLDDRDRVVEAFREYGLKCWQVRAGAY
jgi:hypothetical protein